MTNVIGVRFRRAGKVYFFSPGKLEIRRGDNVIVETARGVEFGHVVAGPRKVEEEKITQPLKSVIRIANKDDYRREEKNREREKEAFAICQEKIRKHGLEMKLIDAEYTLLYRGRADRLPRAGQGPGGRVPHQDRAAADRRAGRDEDPWRHRHLRQAAVL